MLNVLNRSLSHNTSGASARLNTNQLLLDQMSSSFSAGLADWRGLASMTLGGAAYQLCKLATLPVLPGMMAKAFSLTFEVATFRASEAVLRNQSLEGAFTGRGLLSTGLDFFLLKGAGRALEGQNSILTHAGQSFMMAAGHELGASLHLVESESGTFLQKWLKAEVSNIQMIAGLQCLHRMLPVLRLSEIRRESELKLMERPSHAFRPINVMALEASSSQSALYDLHEKFPELIRDNARWRGIRSAAELEAALILASVAVALRGQGIRFNVDQFDVNSAEMSFVNLPNIRAITGRELFVPMLAFKRLPEYLSFLSRMNQRPVQGLSLHAPYGVITSALNMRLHLSRDLGIIIYCKETYPGQMLPVQIRDHEATHGIDPRINRSLANPESILITEMAATIGELATPEYDHYRAKTFEGFWMGYILQYARTLAARDGVIRISPALQRLLHLPVSMTRGINTEAELIAQAQAMVAFVNRITNDFGNAQLVRILFECDTFADLESRLASARRPMVEIVDDGDE